MLRISLLVVCVLIGLKLLEVFFINSIVTNNIPVSELYGRKSYKDLYFQARFGQLISISLFLTSQLAGGALLRAVFFRQPQEIAQAASIHERIRALLISTLAFAAITGACAVIIVIVITRRV